MSCAMVLRDFEGRTGTHGLTYGTADDQSELVINRDELPPCLIHTSQFDPKEFWSSHQVRTRISSMTQSALPSLHLESSEDLENALVFAIDQLVVVQ
jgi:hypothetical protein